MGEQSLTITKGVAAVFIVLSLSGAPVFLRDSLSQFSLPLLMLCTGYSLSNSKHENADTFLGASVRTIYWPFWCWSLFFLVTHNLFSWLLIVNAPAYSGHDLFQRLWNITFCMSDFDGELAMLFWIFRALLVASVFQFFCFKLFRHIRPADSIEKTAYIVAAGAFVLTIWQQLSGLSIAILPDGGWREMLSAILVGIGFSFGLTSHRLRLNIPVLAACFLVSMLGAIYCPWNMTNGVNATHLFILLPSWLCAFVLIRALSNALCRKPNLLASGLTVIGKHALSIIAFTPLSFKFVAAIGAACCGLPWSTVGGVSLPVPSAGVILWPFAFIAGICLPIIVTYTYRRIDKRVDMSFGNILRMLLTLTITLAVFAAKTVRYVARKIYDGILATATALKDIVKASSPKEE